MKTALATLLESKKFWTLMIGIVVTTFGTWLAKHGFDMSDAHVAQVAEYMTIGFTALLGGQALQDQGKEKAKVEAAAAAAPKTPEGGFSRLGVMLVIASLGLSVACGASAREKTLHVTYTAVVATQAGFESYDKERQAAIVDHATSLADGVAELDKYKAARSPVLTAFEVTYRALAAAAIENKDPKSLDAAKAAAKQLEAAVDALTGGGK